MSAAARGTVIEFRGEAIRALDMDARMTVCNMSIEAGARAGMIAPDETTYAYLKNAPRAPKGAAWDEAVARWKQLPTDPGAKFDHEIDIDASALEPMITYGTNPGMVIPVTGSVPARNGDAAFDKSLAYMGFEAGAAIRDKPVNVVFVGSCTNARLSDLRDAASRAARPQGRGGRADARSFPARSRSRKLRKPKGLDRVFKDAGAEWRESGCSMCLGMNGDLVGAGQYSVSTSNRNFEGRQGVGARTLLASPLTAAASAVRGKVTDPARACWRAELYGESHAWNPSKPFVRARRYCRSRTSTPTRSSRPASCAPPRAKASASTSSPSGATTPTASPARTSR